MKMQNAEMEFATFDANDVIATSGEKTVTLANFGDGTTNNGTFTFGDKSYISDGSVTADILATSLSDYFGVTIYSNAVFYNGSVTNQLAWLMDDDRVAPAEGGGREYNGVYAWIAANNRFEKKQ